LKATHTLFLLIILGNFWIRGKAGAPAEVPRVQYGRDPATTARIHPQFLHREVPELALTVMEDLSSHTIMRKGLIEGNTYPLFTNHIGIQNQILSYFAEFRVNKAFNQLFFSLLIHAQI
jgi:5-methylthioribose kinase